MSEAGEYVRTKIRRAEIISYVVVAMIIVGMFDWVGITYLESASQQRANRSSVERKFLREDLNAICGALKVTCPTPAVSPGG